MKAIIYWLFGLFKALFSKPDVSAQGVDSSIRRPSIHHNFKAKALYGPTRFAVTGEMVAKMRSEVALAVAEKWVSPPTEDQWKMILSDNPATCVIAGAGSGKSTTLVLRVVFMVCHLGIRPCDLTVVSFTRNSCAELREKIRGVLSIRFWLERLHPDDARDLETVSSSLVSTFHAALSKVARKAFPGVQWFDVLSDEELSLDAPREYHEPLISSQLSERQKDLLQEAYLEAFVSNRSFREHIVSLIKIECDRDLLSEQPEKDRVGAILRKASERDLELVVKTNQKWSGKPWRMEGVDPTPFEAFRAEGNPFYANGRVIETNMPIFLSLNGFVDNTPLFASDEIIDGFPVNAALKVRRDIVAKYYPGNKLDIRSTKSLDRLALRVKYIAKSDFAYKEAPRIDVLLSGEMGRSDILDAFYSQASCIENLGLEVTSALNKSKFPSGTVEHHFAAALAIFWTQFEKTLRGKPTKIMTFNRAFLSLGESGTGEIKQIDPESLRRFTHLLVDEFQDISPQIVSWLKATQRTLLEAGHRPSLMAIGDDWQSIYGWRGSAPELFIGFSEHFPSTPGGGGHLECRMMENYRSVNHVITDAERLLRPVRIKIEKTAKAKRPAEDYDHGVKIITSIDFAKNIDPVVSEIHTQLDFVNSLPKADRNKVVILSRSNKVLDAIKAKIGNKEGVVFYTFHSSKGLQGEVAILCDNCDYDQKHVFRNAMYKASGLFRQTYDEAAKDESLRLAYVAVTRGIRRVIWFLDKPIGAAALLKDKVAV